MSIMKNLKTIIKKPETTTKTPDEIDIKIDIKMQIKEFDKRILDLQKKIKEEEKKAREAVSKGLKKDVNRYILNKKHHADRIVDLENKKEVLNRKLGALEDITMDVGTSNIITNINDKIMDTANTSNPKNIMINRENTAETLERYNLYTDNIDTLEDTDFDDLSEEERAYIERELQELDVDMSRDEEDLDRQIEEKLQELDKARGFKE